MYFGRSASMLTPASPMPGRRNFRIMAKTLHKKYQAGQPIYFCKGSYLDRSSQPVYSLLFLLPFIIFYELGTIFISSELVHQWHIRVVAFVWLQSFAMYLGLTGRAAWLMAPLIVVVILVALQMASRKPWIVRPQDFLPMTAECVILAIPLLVLSTVLSGASSAGSQRQLAGEVTTLSACQHPPAEQPALSRLAAGSAEKAAPKGALLVSVVTGVGAGIYEEFLFRLVLISLLMLLLQDVLGLNDVVAVALAVSLSALLFSLHHHILLLDGQLQKGEAFTAWAFAFRTAAGVYFAALFAIRGFGIAAGTHACYDIIAAFLNIVVSTANS